jgi:hypothetical protein
MWASGRDCVFDFLVQFRDARKDDSISLLFRAGLA